jgi:hypothetical protein
LVRNLAGHPCDIQPTHPPRDHGGGQEIVLQELSQRGADPVLVLGDDGGVRDRQAERMPEQGGDREPVGEAADHRRLRKGANEAPGRVEMVVMAGEKEDRGHHHEHAGGDDPHAPDAALRGVEAGQDGTDGLAHATLKPRRAVWFNHVHPSA